jgi:hypothetical protein
MSIEGSRFCGNHCQLHSGSPDIETSGIADEGEALMGCGCGHPECHPNPVM